MIPSEKNICERLSPQALQAIQIRLASSKASVKKFTAALEATSPDGRCRNQFTYYGAHTGRWSGRAFQPQNLPRVAADAEALQALLEGRPVSSLDALSTCVRPCIAAPPGKKLVVADLSTIEVRALAWLAGCDCLLDVFKRGLDPYISFGAGFYVKDYSNVTKDERQICKPAVLACGFGQGGGQIRDGVKTGLWGYAEKYGVNLTQAQAHDMVNVYRAEYREVVEFWGYLEEAFTAAISNWKEPSQVGYLKFIGTPDAVKIELPSGRCLHYHKAKVDAEGNLSFWGARSHDWGPQSTWGGKLTENVVQAVARDVLAEGMLRAEDAGLKIAGHVHDELLVESDAARHGQARRGLAWHGEAGQGEVERLVQAMSAPISWAPGLPLAAEGWEGERYEK